MRDQEKVAKPPRLAQTGWCGQELLDHTTPSAPSKEASLLLLDVALPVRLFEGCDQRFLPKDVPQFIQAFQQTGSREAVDLKMSANAAELQGLVTQIDNHFGLRRFLKGLYETSVSRGVHFNRQHTILQRVFLEDIGEGRGNQNAKAKISDGPDRMFAGAAASEVLTRDQDLSLSCIGDVEDLGRLKIGEQLVTEAGLVDPLEKTSRNDLVRVDVFSGEAGCSGLHAIEFSHMFFPLSGIRTGPSPLLARRGGRDIKKISRSFL